MATETTECGVFAWRPSWLQRFANLPSFTAVMATTSMFAGMQGTYYSAVISQIERRYGLSSFATGFIKNVDNIGVMLMVIVCSHFLRFTNKPRVFTGVVIMTAISIFIMALPHFVFHEEMDHKPQDRNRSYVSEGDDDTQYGFEYCQDEASSPEAECGSASMRDGMHIGALALFFLSEILQGVARAPKFTMTLTYLDDNSKNTSPRHFGFLFGTRSFAPILGFMLAAWTSSIYVDLSDPGLSPRDPRWVGAWWLGFVICAALTIIWAPIIACFPAKILPRKRKLPAPSGDVTEKQKLDEDVADENQNIPVEAPDFCTLLKDLPRSMGRLFRNPVYALTLVGGCSNVFIIGFMIFMPKYIANMFGQTPAMASVYTGVVTVIAMSVGPMVSGVVITRRAVTTRNTLRFMVVVQLITVFMFGALGFIGCDGPTWAGGTKTELGAELRPVAACNANCSCSEAGYNPVCGADGLTYFSSCYAGCDGRQLNSTAQEFFGCACVEAVSQTAVLGACAAQCSMLPVFLCVLFVSLFAAGMAVVPAMTVFLRCVDDQDKTMAIAVASTLINAVAFPAPILFGAVIDGTCLVHQVACGRQGACLYYDTSALRIRQLALCAGIKVIGAVLFIIAYLKAIQKEDKEKKLQKSIDHKDDELQLDNRERIT